MFDFLGLPREIRDEIYVLCLVREKIEFEEFYVDETAEDWMRDRKPEALTLQVARPGETPLLVYQGVSFVHRVESLTPINGRSRWDDVFYKDRERSYRIHRGTINPPCLNIFHTNCLIYQESSMTFYAKNCFCFPSRECELTLNACSAFLTDRPEQALTYISDISLGIGFIGWRHPALRDYRGSLLNDMHWPTMQRFVNILRDTLGPRSLHKLKMLYEEQCPSDRALSDRLKSKDYCSIFDQPLGVSGWSNSLRNLKDLQVDTLDTYEASSTLSRWKPRYIARLFIGHSAYDSSWSSSAISVGGKEMSHTRLTWSPSND